MRNSDLIDVIKSDVSAVANQGHEAVGISDLIRYLDALKEQATDEKSFDQLSLEKFRASHQSALTQFEKLHESRMEIYRSTIMSGQAAMKSTILINGGAAVALLAFIGHLVSSGQKSIVPSFALPLFCFVAAALCGVVAVGLTYVTLSSYNINKTMLGNISNTISVGVVVLSYILFAVGCYNAYLIFSSMVGA